MTNEERSRICVECQNCCKYIALLSDGDNASFLVAWGYDLRPIAGRKEFTATLYHPCRHLSPEGCDAYDTRPSFCKQYWACDDIAMTHLCKLTPSKEAQ